MRIISGYFKGKKILNIDKESNYLSPIVNYCVFNLKKTKKRNDLKLNKLNDEDSLDEEVELLLSTKKFNQKIGNGISILYGGSVTPKNASDILNLDNVDGALVGGASLKARDFCKIIDSYN